jgi:putative transposase
MAWGMVEIDEQRVRFVVHASRGEKNLRELCNEFKISRPTGYTWLRRFQARHRGGGGKEPAPPA